MVALAADDRKHVSFDAFFTHILMHELMHGLGPDNITVGGRATNVRQEFKDAYSTIEEAKADVSGLFALQFLVDHEKLDKAFNETMYTTYLASMFRLSGSVSMRRTVAALDSAQLLPRQRRCDRRAGRDLRRQRGAHQEERRRSDARHHDHAGNRRRLRPADRCSRSWASSVHRSRPCWTG